RKAVFAGAFLVCMVAVVVAMAQSSKQFSPKAQARITKEVRHRILMLPEFGTFDNIAFTLNGYDVVLLGQVTRSSLKSDAGHAVKRIEGVENVDTRIEVLPVSINDDRF